MLITPWENIDKEPDNPFDEYRIPPPIIYHYTSIDTAALIIGNQTLKFAPPPEFNDPLDMYEGLITYQTDSRTIRTWIKRKFPQLTSKRRRMMEHLVLTRPEAAEKFKGALTKIKLNSGVCCFSKVPDQVLMWSHYAQKHRGVCLGFSFQPSQHLLSPKDFIVRGVNYPRQVQPIDYFEDTFKAINHWVFTKAPCWAYEKEVRAVINGMPASPDIQFDKACLKEIYFGCRTTAVQRASLTKLLKANGFSLVTWQQMQIDDATFSVKAVPYEVSTS